MSISLLNPKIIPLPPFLCLILTTSAMLAAPPEASLPEKHRAFFKSHCLDCHDSETREGKVDLEVLPFRITTLKQAELWQKVLGALNAGEMPPEDVEQPGNAEKADFLDDLAQSMVTARRALSDSGGRITMRRLNRREYGHPPAIWIDWVELEGPIANASGQSAFTASWAYHDADLEETPRARKILEQFAQHAFREVSPDPEFIDRLVRIFQARLAAGDSFDVAIRTPLSVILASPGFLYLYEPGDEALRRQLDDRELAVRLSYFLWSGPPDSQLLELAEKNELHIPETLRQQVDRLIADPRSDEFVAGFVHQWLDMERLDFFQFDVNLYRDFDESTRAATREEVYQSFAHLLRDEESGRIGKLIKSDYVFVNGLLATYYGMEGFTGDEFRKITLPADSPRGGLLGMAAIHAMGSDGICL